MVEKELYRFVVQAQCFNLIFHLIMMDHLDPERFVKQLISLANSYRYIYPEELEEMRDKRRSNGVFYQANPWLYIGIAEDEAYIPKSLKKAMYEMTFCGETLHVIINLPEEVHHTCSVATLPENGAIMLGMFGPDFIRESVDAMHLHLMCPELGLNPERECLPFEAHHIGHIAADVQGRRLTALENEVLNGLMRKRYIKQWRQPRSRSGLCPRLEALLYGE